MIVRTFAPVYLGDQPIISSVKVEIGEGSSAYMRIYSRDVVIGDLVVPITDWQAILKVLIPNAIEML